MHLFVFLPFCLWEKLVTNAFNKRHRGSVMDFLRGHDLSQKVWKMRNFNDLEIVFFKQKHDRSSFFHISYLQLNTEINKY